MDAIPYGTLPRWWPPRLSPLWIALLRRGRIRLTRRRDGLVDVAVHGLDHLRRAVEDGCGVLITPNHASHADPFVLLRAADHLGRHFYHMVAWQSFLLLRPISRWVIQRHGCFSVNSLMEEVARLAAGRIVRRQPAPAPV
jgi:1-acyl-sn-glycerol-3-phosphate acyltransferase